MTVRVYESELGWSVSENDVWLPGLYETEGTAIAATIYTDGELQTLSDRVCSIYGEDRRITLEDLFTVRI